MVRQSGKAESRITGGRDQGISNRADLVLDDAQRSRMRVTGGCRSRLIAAETASSPASSKSLNSLGQRCLATTCCERKRSLPFVVNGFLSMALGMMEPTPLGWANYPGRGTARRLKRF